MDSDGLRNIKLIAMHGVVKSTEDYNVRHIFRWYSKTFNTPLHVVDTLPFEDVLTHYFENQYEELHPDEREDEVHELLLTPDQLKKLRLAEDAMDADTYEFEKETAASPPPVNPADSLDDKVTKLKNILEVAPERLKSAEAPLLEPIPEGIHMTFEDLEDAPSFGPPPKAPTQ
jgi:hypothetical protein